jgi:hypothetical protein
VGNEPSVNNVCFCFPLPFFPFPNPASPASPPPSCARGVAPGAPTFAPLAVEVHTDGGGLTSPKMFFSDLFPATTGLGLPELDEGSWGNEALDNETGGAELACAGSLMTGRKDGSGGVLLRATGVDEADVQGVRR